MVDLLFIIAGMPFLLKARQYRFGAPLAYNAPCEMAEVAALLLFAIPVVHLLWWMGGMQP